jgi:hypothetical protein
MVKLFYHKEFFNGWCSELAVLYPDLIKTQPIDDIRFNNLNIADLSYYFVDNIVECDFVVLPFKWCGFNPNTNFILNKCKTHDKKILVFYNDDNSSPIILDGYVFRTSLYKHVNNPNELGLPPFFEDEFKNEYIIPENIKLNIGFCGFDHYERRQALNVLRNNPNIETDFITRKSFWAREIDEQIAITEFNNNITKNLFGFTARGGGNFSYRFYQILSMGRIPILLNTDCVLPFDDLIDYNKHCLIVDVSDINNMDTKVIEYYNNKTKTELYDIQLSNRLLYENFLSPSGFLKTLNFTLKKNKLN